MPSVLLHSIPACICKCTVPNSLIYFTDMDYIDYEGTLSIISKTFFSDFKFYSQEAVANTIATIPDDLPDLPGYDSSQPMVKAVHSNGSKMTSAEIARMKNISAAKILLLGDTRKAQAVFDFVKTMFLRT